MALIFIKRRREPIQISNERARKIKALRFGDMYGNGKADPSEMIDLGDEWAGELAQIATIEITKEERTANHAHDIEAERAQTTAEQLSKPIEMRAKEMGRFKLAWMMRSGMVQKDPPQEVMDEAEHIALEWFKVNSGEPELNAKVLEPLLLKYWGEKKEGQTLTSGLVKKMELSPEQATE